MNGQPLPVRARLPGADGGAGALRLRVRDQVAGRPRGDQVRQVLGVLDRARLGGEGAGQDPVAHRRARRRAPAVAGGLGAHRRQRVGPAHRDREGGVPARRRRVGARPSSAACPTWTPGCSGPASVDVDPGEHRVVVRATDRSGYTQTSVEADVVPDGATGWHSISLRRRYGWAERALSAGVSERVEEADVTLSGRTPVRPLQEVADGRPGGRAQGCAVERCSSAPAWRWPSVSTGGCTSRRTARPGRRSGSPAPPPSRPGPRTVVVALALVAAADGAVALRPAAGCPHRARAGWGRPIG